MRYRTVLLAAASVASLASFSNAFAQDAAGPDVSEIVVTGTRAVRSRLETIAPVDVIDNKSLARQGNGVELAQALANLTPAIDFPRPAITDGSDHVRPATLRGLAPDQTLVLVNGVRGHVSAIVNVNGSIGRGSTAFDLNTIPSVALDRVEVLRDGASAQYGADAIAGVINLRLREARSGGSVTANWGNYETNVNTARYKRNAHDGLTESLAGWVGLPLGADGFLTISGEAALRHATNRSDIADAAVAPVANGPKVIGRYGDPDMKSGSIWVNAGLPINDTWKAYGWAGYQDRNSDAAATPRPFGDARNVLSIYPGGFTPMIKANIKDYTASGGIKGDAAGWAIDANLSYGRNELAYRVHNSLNASYGAASQTSFYAGKLAYDQTIGSLHADKGFDVGFAEPLNVALGVEYRNEEFELGAGEPTSYNRATGAASNLAGGSQGFPGFRPANAGKFDRHNWSAFIDLEGKVTEKLTLGAAGRYEDYSDFGDKATGKVSGRYDFNSIFALRGSVSSGFKAPALQQQFFSYTATNNVTTVVGGVPVTNLIESGKFRVTDPVAIALGAKPLKPETSMNYTLGGVMRLSGFELTVDAYKIKIKDRIALSENIGTTGPAATVAQIQSILAPFGVSAAQFFLNGVETETRGVDVVGHYRYTSEEAGRFDFTLAGNFNNTNVLKTPSLPTLTSVSQPTFLFDRGNRLSYEKGTPETKIVASVDWQLEGLGASFKTTSYDSVLVPNNNAAADYRTGAATIADVEGRYTFNDGWAKGTTVALGVNNLTDVYPNATPVAINAPSGAIAYPGYSPFGFNGRFLYGRVTYAW